MDEQRALLKEALAAEDAGDVTHATELYKKCLALNEHFARGWIFYASLLKQQKDWEGAIKAAEHAAEDDDRRQRATAYSIIGICYLEQRLTRKAVEAFQQSLSNEPRETTWVFLGYANSGVNQSEVAIRCYKAALRLDSDYDEAHYNLGVCYLLRGKYKLAIQHFQRAIQSDPNYALAYAELGFALARTGATEEALQEAKKALLRSVELDAAYGWSRIYLGNLLWRLGDIGAANEHYEAAIRIWPTSEVAHCCYGTFLAAATHERVKAEYHLRKAVECDAKYADVHYHLGVNLLRWGQRKKGEQYLRKAAMLGDERAKKIVATALMPKRDRFPTCPKCRESLKNRHGWWCSGCGADLRAPKSRRKPD